MHHCSTNRRLDLHMFGPCWVAIATFLVFAATEARATQSFSVLEIQGRVLVWPPWSSAWETVKRGSLLKEGALLQSEGSAKLVLRRLKPLSSEERMLELTTTGPSMLRLTGQLNRKFTLSSVTLDARSSSHPWIKSAKSRSLADRPIASAWQRANSVSAVVNNLFDGLESLFTAKNDPKDITSSEAPKPVEVIFPKDGSQLFVDRFPTDIVLTWKPLGGEADRNLAEIYLWEENGKREKPIGSGRAQGARVTIPKAGRYHLQVSIPSIGRESRPVFIVIDGL